jgi:hypothetical protein
MLRSWHTGHSLAAGVLGGLLLASHVWTVALVAFLLGFTAGLVALLTVRAAVAVRAWGTGRARFAARPSRYPEWPPW